MAENSQRKPSGSGSKINRNTSPWRKGGARSTPPQQSSQRMPGPKPGIGAQESSQHKNSGKYKGKVNVRKYDI